MKINKQGEKIRTGNVTDASSIAVTVTVRFQVWQKFFVASKINLRTVPATTSSVSAEMGDHFVCYNNNNNNNNNNNAALVEMPRFAADFFSAADCT